MTIAGAIAMAQGKGGVGKTSLTCNVAGLLAAAGHRVLVVDLDPQGNCARDLGYEVNTGQDLFLSFLQGIAPPLIKDVRPNLDVVPGGPEFGDIAATMVARASRGDSSLGQQLERMLNHVAADYDIILIDTPPGDRVIVEGVFAVVDGVVIPTRSDEASLDGVERVAERYLAVRDVNPALRIVGVVLFAIGARSSRLEQSVRDSLASMLGENVPVFSTRIREAQPAAADARRLGLLVHELEQATTQRGARAALLVRDAKSLADDYQGVAQELVGALSAVGA